MSGFLSLVDLAGATEYVGTASIRRIFSADVLPAGELVDTVPGITVEFHGTDVPKSYLTQMPLVRYQLGRFNMLPEKEM